MPMKDLEYIPGVTNEPIQEKPEEKKNYIKKKLIIIFQQKYFFPKIFKYFPYKGGLETKSLPGIFLSVLRYETCIVLFDRLTTS